MGNQIDPLASPELHRALAFARARETYPGLPSDLLLEMGEAAWERVAGDGRDGAALDRFERALDLVARRYRAGAGRLSVSEVAEQAIPVAALAPYVRAASARPTVPEPEPAPAPPRRTLGEKLARIPMVSPAPVGALALGVLGLAVAGQSGALPAGPLSPASSGDDGPTATTRDEHAHASKPAPQAGGPSTLGRPMGSPARDDLFAGVQPAEGGDATAPASSRASAAKPEPGGSDAPPEAVGQAATAPAPVPAAPPAAAEPAPAAPDPEPVVRRPVGDAAPPAVETPDVDLQVTSDEGPPAQPEEKEGQQGQDDQAEPPRNPQIQLPNGVTLELPASGVPQPVPTAPQEPAAVPEAPAPAPPVEPPAPPVEAPAPPVTPAAPAPPATPPVPAVPQAPAVPEVPAPAAPAVPVPGA